jgi:hypothetical protein
VNNRGISFGKSHVCYTCLFVFCIVFCVQNAILLPFIPRKSLVIFLTSLPLYVKVTLLILFCAGGSVCMFCFCEEVSNYVSVILVIV